jgi:hypothetical protein
VNFATHLARELAVRESVVGKLDVPQLEATFVEPKGAADVRILSPAARFEGQADQSLSSSGTLDYRITVVTPEGIRQQHLGVGAVVFCGVAG